ncbi:MAG: hypothetical protein R3A48_08230 [Polyangiales bacterium]
MRHRSSVPVALALFAMLGCSDSGTRSFGAADAATASACTSNAQCDDRIPCTRDVCVVGGVCEHLADNSMCAAPQVCTVGVGCAAPGARRCARAADCDDNVACTRDSCLVDGTCRNSPQDDQCPSGQRCLETGCGAGGTSGRCAAPADCDDRLDCTEDTCNASGQCIHVAQNARCGAGRVCRAGMGCVAERSCSSDQDCDDGLRCNGVERCSELACSAGTPIACDDGVACTIDACVEGDAGMCTHTMDPTCMSMSVPSGIYAIAPPVRYMCSSLLGTPVINLNISNLQFSYVGGMLSVNGVPCMEGMRGASPVGQSFSVSCRNPGSCHEDYRLEGNFIDGRRFNGTLTLTFVDALPPLGCSAAPECTNQRWVVSGTLM